MNDISFTNDEFFISFVEERSEFAKTLDDFVSIFRPERTTQDRPETALVVHSEGYNKYLILYGDHREAYAALAPDLAKCLDYFRENIHLMGHSSDSLEDTN